MPAPSAVENLANVGEPWRPTQRITRLGAGSDQHRWVTCAPRCTLKPDLRARDARDASRDAAPMVAAADALLLDTTDLSIDAAVAEALAYVKGRLPRGAA